MPDTSTPTPVRYVIVIDNTAALRETERTNKALASGADAAEAANKRSRAASDTLTATLVANAKASEGAFGGMGRSLDNVAHLLTRVAEAGLATFAVIKAGTAVLVSHATAAGSVATSGDQLATTYRVVRLALSPTVFTAATLGAGILAEETLRLTYNTGKLIEQRAILAARSGLDIRQVTELAGASRLAGQANDFYLKSLLDLKRGLGSASPGVLKSVGLDANSAATPENLARIGAAFEKISDPIKRAQVAIALFPETFDKILPHLDSRIKESIKVAHDFGAALGPEQAENIDLAKRNLESLTQGFEGFFTRAILRIQQVKAEIADFASTGINALFFAFGEQLSPDARASRRAVDDARLRGNADTLAFGDKRSVSDASTDTAYDVFHTSVAPILDRLKNTREGIESEVGKLKSRRDEAIRILTDDFNGIGTIKDSSVDGGKRRLTTSDRLFYKQEVISTSQELTFDEGRVKGLDAEKRAAEFRKTALEEEYSGLAKVLIQRQEEIKQNGLTAKARADIEIGYQALVAREEEKFGEASQKSYEQRIEKRIQAQGKLFAAEFLFNSATADITRQTAESSALFGVTEAGFRRDAVLRALDGRDAQTVKQKVSVAQQRSQAEQDFLVTSLGIKTEAIGRESQREIADLQDQLQGGKISPESFASRRSAIVRSDGEKGRQLTAETQAGIDRAQGNAQSQADEAVRSSQQRNFDSLKTSASGLLDILTSRTKNLGEEVGNFFRAAILTPLKEIASSQIARLLFGIVNPGQSVSFDRSGGGTGRFGKAGGILGAFGLGTQPIFKGGQVLVAGSSAPGGSVSADSYPGLSAPLSRPFFNDPTGLDINSSGGGSAGLFPHFENTLASNSQDGIFPALGGIVGGPGGTSGFAGPVGPLGTAANYGLQAPGPSGGGGLVGSLGPLSGLIKGATPLALIGAGATLALAGITSQKQTAGSSLSTIGGIGLLGAGIGAQAAGRFGGVIGVQAGIGAGLVVDGSRRRSIFGAFESVGGGALAGAAIGSLFGPGGTLIGAGVGAAVGGLAALIGALIPTGRQQVKDQVKSIYHLDISNGIADQILAQAKQSFGGSISVAIRSPGVLDLLNLYAQSTGQQFFFKNTPRPAYLTENGGGLFQQAQYVNGQAYSYASGAGIGTLGGIPTQTIPQFTFGSGGTQRVNGVNYPVQTSQAISISLDPQATQAVLSGNVGTTIAANPRLVAAANAAAQNGSFDRRQSAARAFAPGLLLA